MTLKNWIVCLSPYWASFLAVQLLTRIFLLFYSGAFHTTAILDFIEIFATGFIFDLQVLGFFLIPLILGHLFLNPTKTTGSVYPVARLISFGVLTYIWLFAALSEFFFWQEFSTRFNFIAVDYLVYTQEVIGNIQESYPLAPLLSLLAVITTCITYVWRKALRQRPEQQTATNFRFAGIGLMILPIVASFLLSSTIVPEFHADQSEQELAKNGTYALFSAYRNNELSYKGFYQTVDKTEISGRIRTLIQTNNSKFTSQDPDDISRVIKSGKPEQHKNVVMIVMESMSAEYMQSFGNTQNLTPNLDTLAKQGLFFTNLYATGTRTVRGLEALSLSVPPTPGQSIIRRQNNGGLFSLGSVFADRGYDTAFIYGGHGYFDNMNAYYQANGFRTVDRTDFVDADVHFSNVWGVCDEDLFTQVIQQADQARADNKPFFYMVMTTSNHRPYTFPQGKIDLPAKGGGREAGVKYADYAVGELIKQAKTKNWFNDTIFIFVSDHTAGAGGKTELSINRYHIPAIFYAPHMIKPKNYTQIASQIDVPPVLLGLLNFSYISKFYGQDVIHAAPNAVQKRAFISNYQKIGLLRDGTLAILEPKRLHEEFSNDEKLPIAAEDQNLLLDTITYYQHAADWRNRMQRVNSVIPSVP